MTPLRDARDRDAAHRDDGVATRRAALEILARVEDDGAYANLALGPALARSELDARDRALVTDLTYGTLRWRRALEHLVSRFLSDTPPPPAHRALLLGTYQLVNRGDIPSYAAVSATVGAAPKRYRGLVNAVLRRVSDAPVNYPDEATRLSYPDWILDRLTSDLGHDKAVAALEAMNEPAETHVRADGYVQDPASQWVATSLLDAIEAPGIVLDLCAAPGGKATAMAVVEGIWVGAAVHSPRRMSLLAANAARLCSTDLSPLISDGLAPALREKCADAVLVDAPCSGLGVLRRRPDARWRIDVEAPQRLAALQCKMLDAAVTLLKPGGVLVYSVCTLTTTETLGVDDYLRAGYENLVPLTGVGPPWEPWGRGEILLPQTAGTDGMALFRYRRV